MISWLKRHFVPHKGNGHRPHLLHGENAHYMVLIALMFEVAFFLGPVVFSGAGANFMAAVLPAVLSDLTNQEREGQQLADLKTNPLLDQAAAMKANDMATKGYFAHIAPDGTTPWHWFDAVGYDYEYAGENLAIDFSDSKDVTNAWMNSPTHRANILKGSYTEIGTGVATGTYEGHTTVFVVQEYAKPMPKQTAAVAAAAPAPAKPVVAPKAVAAAPKTAEPKATEIATTSRTAAASAPVAPTTTGDKILGAETAAIAPSLFDKIMSSPRHTMNVILGVVGALVLIALILMLLHVNGRHPDLVTNAIFVLVILFGIYLANNYFGSRNAAVSTGVSATSTPQAATSTPAALPHIPASANI